MVLFYTLNWEEYHTGILRTTCNGIPLGCTELQYTTMLFFAAPAIFGPGLREYTLRTIGSQFVPAFRTPATVADWMLAQGVKDRIMHA